MFKFGNSYNNSNNNLEKEKSSKAILVLGPLGSGKTTLINNLAPNFLKDTIIIVNDIGTINIDETRMGNLDTIALKQGCICCQDLNSLEVILRDIKEEEKNGVFKQIIIEPSGIAEGSSIKKSLKNNGFDVSTIFLGDEKHFNDRSKPERQVEETQLKVADIVGITWKDPNNKEIFLNWIKDISPDIEIIDIPNNKNKTKEFFPGNDNFFESLWKKIFNIKLETRKTFFRIMKEEESYSHNNFHSHHSNEHNHSLSTISFEKAISKYKLEKIINKLGKKLIRAKGVLADGQEFDFVHGSLNYGDFKNKKGFFNLITSNKIDENILKEINLEENNSLEEKIISEFTEIDDFSKSEEKIQKLINQFFEYMDLSEKINILQKSLENNENIEEVIKAIQKLELKQKILGDEMKYDNPYIWIQYKVKAYKGIPDEINTIGDFVKHCYKSPTYICGKRFNFLNKYLKEKYNTNLLEIDENLKIEEFLKNNLVQELSENKDFMKEWLEYEYFTINENVAKWENYKK